MVYFYIIPDVVDNLMEGYSCCIFAYGQTGAGKTHTMQGSDTQSCDNDNDIDAATMMMTDTDDNEHQNLSEDHNDERGLIPRVLQYLFRKVEHDKKSSLQKKVDAEKAILKKVNKNDDNCDTEMTEEGGADNDEKNNQVEEEEEEEDDAVYTYDEVEYRIRCSYVEIYNETVSDLLNIESINNAAFQKKILTIREDSKRGVFVDGVTEEVVKNASDTYKVFQRGSQNRAVGSTAMNRESSRSHSVFTVSLESKRYSVNLNTDGKSGGGGIPSNHNANRVVSKRSSTLHLVDLAGSERQKHSEATGQTLKEATAINKSLSKYTFSIIRSYA